jgi:hypothetical protein
MFMRHIENGADWSKMFDLGGSGPTRSADAGWGAGAFDALRGWEFLCGEVSE